MSDSAKPTIIWTILGILALLIGILVSLVGGQTEIGYGVAFGGTHFQYALCIIGMGISVQLLGIGLILIGKR
jgi:hypothetical protein